jgi:pantoate--beta-alanine ligase
MKVLTSPKAMNSLSKGLIGSGKRIGFVPTMGALHKGHISLVKKAVKENDIAVASIFVNPRQFSKGEDYLRYPRDVKKDKLLLAEAGCGVLFYPSAESMYGSDFATAVDVEGLSDIMCGASRPGHFRGVCTVCLKLFNIILPCTAYFGQKDFQQAFIIKKMVKDLNLDVNIKVMPVIRHASGLAMSSRNRYLTQEETMLAGFIYKALNHAKVSMVKGQKRAAIIVSEAKKILNRPGIDIEYFIAADPLTLKQKKYIDSDVLFAAAVRIGRTRLIDNIIVKKKRSAETCRE